MTGDGGLHLFIELEEGMNARVLLKKVLSKGCCILSWRCFFTAMEEEVTHFG